MSLTERCFFVFVFVFFLNHPVFLRVISLCSLAYFRSVYEREWKNKVVHTGVPPSFSSQSNSSSFQKTKIEYQSIAYMVKQYCPDITELSNPQNPEAYDLPSKMEKNITENVCIPLDS